MSYVYTALIAWAIVLLNLVAAFALVRRVVLASLRELVGGSLSGVRGARPSRPASVPPASSAVESAAGEAS